MTALRRVLLAVIVVGWTLPATGLVLNALQSPDQAATSGWWNQVIDPHPSFDNVRTVLVGSEATTSFSSSLVDSLLVALPSALLVVVLAGLAAYALAWTSWSGRRLVLAGTVALIVIPVQITLVPLVAAYDGTGLRGTIPGLWLAHVAFGLPLATLLLRAAMLQVPGDVVEAARTDGASHLDVLGRIVVPLVVPALVAVGTLSFMLVWNDLVVTVALLGGPDAGAVPLPLALAQLVSVHPQDHALLAAGALVTALVPLAVYALLSRLVVSATEAVHLG